MDTRTARPDRQKEVAEILGIGSGDERNPLRRWRTYIIAAAALLGCLALLWMWTGGRSSQAVKYATELAERGDLTVIVTATGTVQPTNQVDISSELSGTVRNVLVDHNSEVRVGQVLAELDTDKLRASVENARATLLAARAKIKNAEATAEEMRLDYERKQKLRAREVASAHDADAAKAAYDRALASVDSAKADAAAAEANLKLAETNLAKACICSPIKGIVLSRNVEPGQIVASSLQAPVLFSIAEDLTKIEVQVDVDEADVGRVREGQHAVFSVDAYPDKKFSATIKELRFGSQIVSGVVTYKAVLLTTNSDMLLRPGMTATAEIIVEKVQDAITVPNAALRFSPPAAETDERNFLQKLTSFGPPRMRKPSQQASSGPDRKIWILVGGAAKEVAVTVGSTDGRRTQIIKGNIEPGQAVIVDTIAAAK